MSTLPPIRDALQTVVRDAVHQLAPEAGDPVINKSKAGFSSDYQSPAAMQLAKVLRKKPRDIAGQLQEALGGAELIDPPDVSGPGFLGLRLSDATLQRYVAAMLADERLAVPSTGEGTVVIDFSSPNVAKRMHIGHIRSTLIGEALRRMGSFVGYEVIGDNHIGDWGTQYGQLIHAWRHWLDQGAFDADPVGELERLYVKFHQDAVEDDSLNEAAREELRKLQAGDPDNTALWEMFRATSQAAFDRVYDRLGVHFDVTLGESHYNDALGPLCERLEREGVARESEGALVVFFPNEEDPAGDDLLPPFLVRKKDGAFLYATTDIATVEYRVERWAPRRILYVTDMRQQNHFEQLFATIRKLGIEADLQHHWFGMMSLPEGSFSTRKGNVIRLVDLLDEAHRRALALLRERVEGGPVDFTEDELVELAETIGMGAIKYADLSNNPQSNVTFSFDKMLSFEGNTAPYLQYTSARSASLARKAAAQGLVADGETLKLVADEERDLVLHSFGFGEAVRVGFDQGKPSILATFLYELAARYHRWWNACPALRAEEPELVMSRLNINALVRKVFVQGLDLLGIKAPEKM